MAGGAVALRGEPAGIAGLLGALEALADMMAPRLFLATPVAAHEEAEECVIKAEEGDESGSDGGGWDGGEGEGSEWGSGAAASVPSAHAPYGYSSGSGGLEAEEEGSFLYEQPSYAVPVPAPQPQRLLASDVRYAPGRFTYQQSVASDPPLLDHHHPTHTQTQTPAAPTAGAPSRCAGGAGAGHAPGAGRGRPPGGRAVRVNCVE